MSHPQEVALEPEKGDHVKKLVLLSVAALVLASSVFAPGAIAQEPAAGEINVQSVTLDQFGNADIVGTLQCKEGYSYTIGAVALQGEKPEKLLRSKKLWQIVSTAITGVCETTGPQPFAFKLGAFEEGKVWVLTGVRCAARRFGSPATKAAPPGSSTRLVSGEHGVAPIQHQ
jgi:hypothetical protein